MHTLLPSESCMLFLLRFHFLSLAAVQTLSSLVCLFPSCSLSPTAFSQVVLSLSLSSYFSLFLIPPSPLSRSIFLSPHLSLHSDFLTLPFLSLDRLFILSLLSLLFSLLLSLFLCISLSLLFRSPLKIFPSFSLFYMDF